MAKEVYYSFDKDKKIDWTYVPTEITDQELNLRLTATNGCFHRLRLTV